LVFGTWHSRALRRDLKGAEADFTKAIEIEPRCVSCDLREAGADFLGY
jgi:hypothetical protein